ncbi:MAG: alanine racemase [Elusimicrobiota bacterium]
MSPARRLYRPTWAEVDLSKIRKNLRRLRSKTRTDLMLVVKADGYGHGAVAVSRAAERAGSVRWFGVSSVEEGVVLREAGIRKPILILGSLYPFESMVAAVRWGLTPTVASLEAARLIARAARRRRIDCHLKIDTGMGRIGVRRGAAAEIAAYLKRAPRVRLGGVYTHLSCADSNAVFTRRQLKLFREALSSVETAAGLPRWIHAANSAAALRFPESRFNLVRPGLAAYGLYPGFEPALELKTKIVFTKNVAARTPISYGALHHTRRRARIATLPIGYGDGLPRRMSLKGGRPSVNARKCRLHTSSEGGRAAVLIRGRRCPIVGAMSMDMVMADITFVPGVRVGEEAVLIGRSGKARIGAEDLAKAAGTIPYEIVTALKARVPRVYRR